MILRNQLRWVGHVIRMEDSRLPKQLLYGELCQGKRKKGRPIKRFKDNVKVNILCAGITPNQLEPRAQARNEWRALTKRAKDSFEAQRRTEVRVARERRKQRQADVPNSASGDFPCPHCPKVCRSRIGLHGHFQAHDRKDSR